MLGKTLILAVIIAGAAGGIVYYGTLPQDSNALEAKLNDSLKTEASVKRAESAVKKGEDGAKKGKIDVKKSVIDLKKGEKTAKKGEDTAVKNGEPSAKKETKRIEPRLPTVRKAEADDGREKLASTGGLPKSADKNMPTKMAEAEPKKETRWLDQYLKNNKSEPTTLDVEAETENTKVNAKNASDNVSAASAVNRYTVKTPESEASKITAPRTFRIENGELVEINASGDEAEDLDVVVDNAVTKIMDEAISTSAIAKKNKVKSDAKSGSSYKGKKRKRTISMMSKSERAEMDDESLALSAAEASNKSKVKRGAKSGSSYKEAKKSHMIDDSTPLLSTVIREAAAINKSELRDQAYFEITEYALSEGRFNSARKAHDKIEQDELSYTAKSRIAVAYAQNGKPSKAFKVINEVDEAELRDFMRLQVIEALIAPESEPQTWQEKAN